MGPDEEYYKNLISEGYSHSEALKFTTQYYPEFTGVEKTRSIHESNDSVNELAKAILSIMENQSDKPQNEMHNEMNDNNGKSLVDRLVELIATIWVWISEIFNRVKNDEKILLPISGILVLSALILFAFSIPETPQSIEGEWTKADQGQVTFMANGIYDDGFQRQSYWILESSTLSITSTGEWMTQNGTEEMYTIEQEIRVQFSEDKMLMWMKWDSIELDGETQDFEDSCVGLIRSSTLPDDSNFDVASMIESYDEQKPSWCD